MQHHQLAAWLRGLTHLRSQLLFKGAAVASTDQIVLNGSLQMVQRPLVIADSRQQRDS